MYDQANPNPKDEAINLNFLFDFLDPGASVSFSFVYILNVEDLLTAMGQVRALEYLFVPDRRVIVGGLGREGVRGGGGAGASACALWSIFSGV